MIKVKIAKTHCLLLAIVLCFSCNFQKWPAKTQLKIILVPLGDVRSDLKIYTLKHLKIIFGNAELLSDQVLPKEAYYEPRGRYRADSIINILSRKAHDGEVYVGITEADISTTNPDRKINDWGVIGLGFCPGKASITSVYRIKNKTPENFFKVVIHEIGHNAGLPHCKSPHCYMQDAEGHDSTPFENGFCAKCSFILRKQGWNI
jgi:archaemetzincin